MKKIHSPPDLAALSAAVSRHLQERALQQKRWGAQGPPINMEFGGKRLVAAFNQLLAIDPASTYHDFLIHFVWSVFGREWWNAELAKADDARHPLVSWHSATREHLRNHSTDLGGVHEAPMTREAGQMLRVAFNLHQIRHAGLLLPGMVKRLKNIRQFQGARYETEVAAAFTRGGFKVELEPEGKDDVRRCEFVATHSASKAKYSVEAKSRHRPGVLGQPIQPSTERAEPHIEGLITKALSKEMKHERVICVDVNFPDLFELMPPPWAPVVRDQIKRIEERSDAPAVVICTNSPSHYLPAGSPARGDCAVMMGMNQPRFQPDQGADIDAEFPGLIPAANAFMVPVPSNWE